MVWYVCYVIITFVLIVVVYNEYLLSLYIIRGCLHVVFIALFRVDVLVVVFLYLVWS